MRRGSNPLVELSDFGDLSWIKTTFICYSGKRWSSDSGGKSGGEKEKECTAEWKTLVTLVTLVSHS